MNFQRSECIFACPITKVISYVWCTLSYAGILYKWLHFIVYFTVQYCIISLFQARSAKGHLHCIPCLEHKELTNEGLMELEAQRKDEERQQEEVTEDQRDSQCRKWQGGFLYLRKHCWFMKHRTQMWNSTQRMQQSFRMQSFLTMSPMTKKKGGATTQTSLDHIFQEGRQNWIPQGFKGHQGQAWVTLQLALHLLLLRILQLYHLPLPLPSPASNSSYLLTWCQPWYASPGMPAVTPHYCTFQGTILQDSFFIFFFLFRVSFLCIIHVKCNINLL